MEKDIEVLFGIPEDILVGLKSGEYKRYGGSIRHRRGYFVAHLKETGRVDLEKINQFLPKVQEQLNLLNITSSIAAVSSVLNLTVSMAGFEYLAYRVNQIENKLEKMDVKLDSIIDIVGDIRDRQEHTVKAKLKNAIEIAERATKRSQSSEGKMDFLDASKLFSETKAYFGLFVEKIIKSKKILAFSEMAYEYFSLYIISVVGEIRTRLYLKDFIASNFELDGAINFIKFFVDKFMEERNILNPDFLLLDSEQVPVIKSRLTQIKEIKNRLESFQEEICFIENNKIDYASWEAISAPEEIDSPFIIIRTGESVQLKLNK
ncbi:hypothetical protein [Neobacillus niacini]|uniref:hypothetical protein n=1 Tax=Neobacillus niacini TaxID=86668 RepID=UPI0021CB74BB|nr:hypothetical protein [Neobacillus niacini]MCM3768131.1 hypothetical protein [Neobacillus niacini]